MRLRTEHKIGAYIVVIGIAIAIVVGIIDWLLEVIWGIELIPEIPEKIRKQ